MENLFEKLKENRDSAIYPYHMPGHKRRACGDLSQDLCGLDITEIDGFDNLHQPTEILMRLQQQAARLYGAEESFFLVNGSTAGILAAVSAALPRGGRILMSRNCHKSAYYAAYLRGLEVTYLYPALLSGFDLYDAVTPEQVRTALAADSRIGAVLLVSPTYEGRISDIRSIAEIVHEKGIPLIVDEAHGSHLGFGKVSPENSCQAGADLVIHSVHKTLPALTQTALLHVSGKLIDRERLRRFLQIYQTSSPSYILMASIGNVLKFLDEEGAEAFETFAQAYDKMHKQLSRCRCLKILPWETPKKQNRSLLEEMPKEQHRGLLEEMPKEQNRDLLEKMPEEQNRNLFGEMSSRQYRHLHRERQQIQVQGVQDIGKLIISTKATRLSGRELYDILLNRYGLQLEMASETYVLAMFTVNDSPEGYQRMTQALLEIDRELEQERDSGKCISQKAEKQNVLPKPVCRIPLAEAWDMETELVALSDSVGSCAGEFVNLYPPGVPVLVPGEQITEEVCDKIKCWLDSGLVVQGAYIIKGRMGSEKEEPDLESDLESEYGQRTENGQRLEYRQGLRNGLAVGREFGPKSKIIINILKLT